MIRRPAVVGLCILSLPLATALTIVFAPMGCGGSDKPPPKSVATTSSSTTTVTVTITDAGPPAPDALSWVGPEVAPPDAPTLSTGDDAASNALDAPGAPCWKGFVSSGNAVGDLAELGKRCCAGMSPLVGPVKQAFKQGESKSIPVPFVPGCYRIIAVGGTGLKDVDLDLKDPSGKIVAADHTPNDVFPMIHPNKELCVDAVQFLSLSITVKKGSGEVAGEVWKR